MRAAGLPGGELEDAIRAAVGSGISEVDEVGDQLGRDGHIELGDVLAGHGVLGLGGHWGDRQS